MGAVRDIAGDDQFRHRARPWRAFDRHHDMEAFVAFDICRAPPHYTRFLGVGPSWDNRPASQGSGDHLPE